MSRPVIVWYRRDLRLADHAALTAAGETGPVIPVFIADSAIDKLGAAPKWRLGLGIDHLATRLRQRGSQLVLRRGPALQVLEELIAETGAQAVFWHRAYDPVSIKRDTEIKADLKTLGVKTRSFGGTVLFEPWTVQTGSGGYYKVYSPFWRAVKDRVVPIPLPEPAKLTAPQAWPRSDDLADWRLGAEMRRGADIVRPFVRLGETAARDRLDAFISDRVETYADARNRPDLDGTSRLSENLAWGEISPNTCWHAGLRALELGKTGAEVFLKELVWREFAYHLMYHTPRILTENWKPEWDDFPWAANSSQAVIAWQQGRTGVPFVDAAMREMYVTGTMHNRGRMIVGSFLTKHLMTHWRQGRDWFEDHLIDWDPASNAMGWQWVAGSGPDAAPYFRVFNPISQREKFDPDRAYVNRWIAEGQANPHADALKYFEAIPQKWSISAKDPYPTQIVDVGEGRRRALDAYQNRGG